MLFAGNTADAVIGIDTQNLVFKTGANAGQDNGTERMRINSNGSIAINGDQYLYAFPSTSNTGFIGSGFSLNGASNTMQLWTNNTEKVRITSTGNVGIGTTSPSSKLTTYGAANTIVSNVSAPLATSNSVLFGVSDTGATKAGLGFTKKDGFRRGDLFLFNNNDANDSTDGSASDARLTINSAGNVGIGTTAPAFDFELNKDNGAGSATYMSLRSNDTGIGILLFGNQSDAATASISYYSATQHLQFNGYNNVERMRIGSTGQVKFNAYTSASAFPNTAVANLAVDSSGNIITEAAGGGSSLPTITVNTGTQSAPGTQTQYTLSVVPSSVNYVNVFINGVYQAKTNYSVSSNVLTFVAAPPLNSVIEFVTTT